ncbi:type II secretion system minor pseudopilin GspI [Thauera linaloolentis]|uniref:Type II secretion system protein I n=1 Tax=Thauera linaloolentis (strain DSM 12138 / JCM 21573 / CCUG 41526 / CIP 105981 / IAM 15112 / NBRC 102519 / 47Lol) TaxID=1123367 RepID=N6YMX3_THAL4|nr:type II secretion system minor pseudopilin GspI [Thauera linaloolentis]ENO83717.1 general secretion pathway protein I [Thauera linaloolentis 47Lol = DSM 12138]MCM8565867.1 type II secretion system minor pseudopilin GspI [Thauera linaloolentis]
MKRHSAGFTLLETLVALSIIALALSAAMRAMGSTAAAAGSLREHTLATWVAENRFAEMRARQEWPAIGQRQGHSLMGGRRYPWTEKVSGTPNPLFRRVLIEVRDGDGDGGAPLVRMDGFAVRPLK